MIYDSSVTSPYTNYKTVSHPEYNEARSLFMVYGLRTRDISALCAGCRSVLHFCRSVWDSSALKYMRHFGYPELKYALSVLGT